MGATDTRAFADAIGKMKGYKAWPAQPPTSVAKAEGVVLQAQHDAALLKGERKGKVSLVIEAAEGFKFAGGSEQEPALKLKLKGPKGLKLEPQEIVQAQVEGRAAAEVAVEFHEKAEAGDYVVEIEVGYRGGEKAKERSFVTRMALSYKSSN